MAVEVVEVDASDLEQLEIAAQTMSDAFAEDPVCAWMILPSMFSSSSYDEMRLWFFQKIVQVAAHDRALNVVQQGSGVALWQSPEHDPMSLLGILRSGMAGLIFQFSFQGTLNALNYVVTSTRFKQVHLHRYPYLYLMMIGVSPSKQGQGLSGPLIRKFTDRADKEGWQCYLESSKESNIPLYEHFGFVVLQKVVLAETGPLGPPTIWLMLREPQPLLKQENDNEPFLPS